jgi:hypothetical protein
LPEEHLVGVGVLAFGDSHRRGGFLGGLVDGVVQQIAAHVLRYRRTAQAQHLVAGDLTGCEHRADLGVLIDGVRRRHRAAGLGRGHP